MAMQKAHSSIPWVDYPKLDTPLNAQNLLKEDKAIDVIDDRVISLDTTKFDKTEAQGLFKDVELDPKTGIITFTTYSGAKKTIDTLLEKIAINFDFDEETQKIIITLEDGTTKEVDLKSFITQYEFLESDTIAFEVDTAGKVKAIVKEGSINEKHLRPDYLADIRVESAKAEAARAAAEVSEANAKKSENAAAKSASDSANSASDSADSADASAASAAAALASQNAAKASETAAKNSQTAAKTSETNAKASETAAKTSETNAGKSATAAAGSATAAATSAAESAESAENAATSETNAGKSASAAATSEKNAKTSENNATTQATSAKNSATSAATSASTASTKASEAATSASNAASSADTATRQATSASSSASTATTQANAAKTSATNAAASATKAQSYAVGGTNSRTGEDTDNAKYYYEQSKSISESFSGALRPKGTVETLPALSSAAAGDMYNVSKDFTTTADFKEGAGHPYPAGTNVYKTSDGKWDCLAGTPVNTVNGKRGDVTITKADVGLGNVDNTADKDKRVSYATSAGTATDNTKLPLAGGTMTGTINSSLVSSLYIQGNQGKAIINSTASGGSYVVLDKMKSTNGVFTDGVYLNRRLFQYTDDSTVSEGNNSVTKSVTILDESGNSSFPGTVTAPTFSGKSTTAGTADKVAHALTFTGGVSKTYDGSTAQSVAIPTSLPANGGNASTVGGVPIAGKTIDANFATKFRTETKGNTSSGDYISTIRTETASVASAPQFGSGIAFGRGDTHSYLYTSYSSPAAYIGGGNVDKLNWVRQIAFTDSNVASATNADTVDGKHAADLQNYNNLTNKPTIPAAYTLPVATSSVRGGVKIGYVENGRNYPVELSNEQMFVNVPWTDNNTDTKVTQTAVTDSANYPLLLAPKAQTTTQTTTACFSSGVTLNPSTNTIAANVSGSAGSVAWTNVSGKPTIPAAVAVKGNAEANYRTGNVNITPANIGLGNVNNTADANKSVASAIKWNGYSIWFGTEAQYTAIAKKDSKTIYFRS